MKKRPHLCVVGDVAGQDDYHLGDEAMLEANLAALRQRLPDIRFTVFSRDPAWTSVRYGVTAVRTPQFPPGVTAEVVDALRDADGLMVSGGGNLCGTWPEKIQERVALIETARDLGRPVVVVGQTLGPVLNEQQRALLAGALSSVAWLGVRDDSSGALAQSLGIPGDRIHRQLDDAFFLTPQPVSDERLTTAGVADLLRDAHRPILVTLDASFGIEARRKTLVAIASQLDALADRLAVPLVFVPHVGGAKVPDGHRDADAGTALAGCLRSPLRILDLWQPSEVRWLIELSAMVVSTRYHPLVFATAAAVPALGIHQDEYTRIKLRGALACAGLDGWCLSTADAERGGLLPLAVELWHQRPTVLARLATLKAEAGRCEEHHWSGVCRALELSPPAAAQAQDQAPCFPLANARSHEEGRVVASDLLTDDQWQRFDRDGYLVIGRVLDDGQLAALRTRIDDLTSLEHDPLVLDLIRHDVFRELCARIHGRHISISILPATLMNLPLDNATQLSWHQEACGGWKLDRDPILTSWLAIDPATRQDGCLQVIPGSHRLGLLSKQDGTISDADARALCTEDAAVRVEVDAGEAVVLHNWMLRRTVIDSGSTPQRALSVSYLDGRTLNTINGTRFPTVFGDHEDVETALPFLQAIRDGWRHYAEMAAEAERYAKSLLADKDQRELMRSEAERYARSLAREIARMRSE